jgi:fructokinase
MPVRIGVDIGGTKIEAAAILQEGEDRTETLRSFRIDTPRESYLGILDGVADLVRRVDPETGNFCPVGVAMPGAISVVNGLVKNCNCVVLNGTPFHEDLERTLGRPVRIENDANCFALSEAVDGAASTGTMVVGVVLGSGVGAGLVYSRQLHVGRNRIAGEWGHNPLPWANEDELAGMKCYCGKTGCIETFLSGRGLEEEYFSRTAILRSSREIGESAVAGNLEARQSIKTYTDRLARGLATLINVIDPDVIVMGGGLSNLDSIYYDLPGLISKYTFSADVGTPILKNRFGDSSGIRGAAWLWSTP